MILAHGEFGKWLEDININHNTANRFMKIASEIPNYATGHNLGMKALYEIATMPEDERDKPQRPRHIYPNNLAQNPFLGCSFNSINC